MIKSKTTEIIVIYVGCINPETDELFEDVAKHVEDVASLITPKTFDGEIIVLPTYEYNTRIECINPKYIIDKDLVANHTKLMKELRSKITGEDE